jgi:glycosyltransferase involved in cell wall biosynthesis
MKTHPSISVIMPVYNAAPYVKAAINSILDQSYSDFEFIIINDASTDRTKEILDTIRDTRIIRIENQENEGNYRSRNKGIETAKGKYICVMDGDDIAHPDRLRIQYEFMEENLSFLAAGSDIKIFSNTSVRNFEREREPEKIKVQLLMDNVCTHPSLIIRREVFFEHHLRYNESYEYSADYDLMVEISRLGNLTNINHSLLYYRRHPLQITSQKHREQVLFADRIRLKQLNSLAIYPSEKEKEFYLRLLKNEALEKEEIKRAEDWLNRLLEQNAKIKIYDPFYLHDFLKNLSFWKENRKEYSSHWDIPLSKRIDIPLSERTYTPYNSLVSIILPVYNVCPDFLQESVESVLSQTYTNFELLIVDDGSTDGCTDILTKYTDPRIRLIKNHHNFIDTLNCGLEKARGKYIARMDADDVMLPHRLQTQYDFMECHPEIDICGSWMERFGQSSGLARVPTEHEMIISTFVLNNAVFHPSVVVRKNSLQNMKYSYDYPCAEDYKLWTELALKGLHFANIPEVLLKYRQSEGQVTQSRWTEMMNSTKKIQVEYIEQVMEKMMERNDMYETILNPLIDLTNEGLITWVSLKQIVYQVYYDMLKCI